MSAGDGDKQVLQRALVSGLELGRIQSDFGKGLLLSVFCYFTFSVDLS